MTLVVEKNKKTYKFGIIGAGNVAMIHAKAIQEIENARLIVLCNRSEDKAKSLAAQFGVNHIYTDYRDVLKNEEIDIVCILTPSGTHGKIAIDAAKAGKHVIVEKPMDVNIDMADKMIQVFEEQGVKLCVISQHRMDESTQILKKAISDEAFGKLVLGDAHIKWLRSQEYYDSARWRGTRDLDGGGVLINQAIHTIDLLLHIMGEVESVKSYCATLNHERIEVEDVATACLKFKNGALGTVVGSTCAYPGLPARLEIHGTKGSARIEGDRLVFLEVKDNKELYKLENEKVFETGASDPRGIDYTSHMLQIEDMIEAIKEDREPLVNGYEGKKSLEIICAIYESSKSGEEVYINSV